MEPYLRWPASVSAKWRKLPFAKGIAVGVLCAVVLPLLTGVVSARRTYTIQDGETTRIVHSTSSDAQEVLKAQDIEIGAQDQVSYTALENNEVQIIIKRAFDVSVTADRQTHSVVMCEGTVADALALAQVEVEKTDRVNVALDEAVHPDSKIVVDRVVTRVVTDKRKIPFKTVKRKTASLYAGERKVSVTGKKGLVVSKTVQTIVNGATESKTVVSQKTVKKARKKVVLIGTKKRPRAIQAIRPAGKLKMRSGKTVRYKKAYIGSATAYSGGGRTSTGKRARVGLVAVDPKIIPYGSRLFIRATDGSYTYGYAVAADTGGAMRSGSALVDLYLPTTSSCYRFGRRNVEVYVLS